MKKKYHTIADVARMLGVKYHRVWYHAALGKVYPLRVGRVTLLTDADVKAIRQRMEANGWDMPTPSLTEK